jgi:hypothetical protein
MRAERLCIKHMRYAAAYADFNAVIYMRFYLSNLNNLCIRIDI